jgi:Cytochrome bd-type quinol oxidase, subunit 1
MAGRKTDYAIKIPWVLGLIATRSIDTVIPGINELVADYAKRIKSGMIAYGALAKIRSDPATARPGPISTPMSAISAMPCC